MTPISYPSAQGMLITRDAHEALAVLKKLVDSAEEKIRLAERETAAVAIGHQRDDDPLRTLRDVEGTLNSQRRPVYMPPSLFRAGFRLRHSLWVRFPSPDQKQPRQSFVS